MQAQIDMAEGERVRDVDAGLTFIVPQDEKPVFHSAAYTGAEGVLRGRETAGADRRY